MTTPNLQNVRHIFEISNATLVLGSRSIGDFEVAEKELDLTSIDKSSRITIPAIVVTGKNSDSTVRMTFFVQPSNSQLTGSYVVLSNNKKVEGGALRINGVATDCIEMTAVSRSESGTAIPSAERPSEYQVKFSIKKNSNN